MFKSSRMSQKYLYFFRGLIAFVAFSNVGTAFKAYVENKCVINEISNSNSSTISRIYTLFTILQAFVMIHCALFIHYKPLISLGIGALTLSIIMHVSEAVIFQSTAYDFRIMFPCALNGITVVGLLLTLLCGCGRPKMDEDENVELLKKSKWMKKTMSHKKEY